MNMKKKTREGKRAAFRSCAVMFLGRNAAFTLQPRRYSNAVVWR